MRIGWRTLLFSFLLVPVLAIAVDSDGDGVDDLLDNCPAISNASQANSEPAAVYDTSFLQVASNIGSWQERFDGLPPVTGFMDNSDSQVGNLIDGSTTSAYEDFWFNHGDEATSGSPALITVKFSGISTVTAIRLDNTAVEISNPDYVIRYIDDYADRATPGDIVGSWVNVPATNASGTVNNGSDVTVTLTAPILTRYLQIELVADTDRVALNEIEITGQQDHVGDVCDICWYVSDPLQEDGNDTCPAVGAGYSSDPLCGDLCEPLPTISIQPESITEGNSGTSDLTFRVELSSELWQTGDDVTFDYETLNNNLPLENGDAEAGVDFVAASGSATIPVGSTFFDFTVAINGDTVHESAETFTVRIFNILGNVADTNDLTVLGTITNDESLPEVSVASPATVEEGSSGAQSPLTFTFSTSALSEQDIVFTYSLTDVTATGSDYVVPPGYSSGSGQATILAGNSKVDVTLQVLNDDIDELTTETISLSVVSTSDGSIATVASAPNNEATLSLGDNDLPQISLPSVGDLEYSEDQAPIFVDQNAVLESGEASFDGGSLTVDFSVGGTTNDVLSIRSVGSGIGEVDLDGSDVRFEGTVVGSFTGGTNNDPLVIVFNSSSQYMSVQAIMRNILYENVSQNPDTAQRVVRMVVSNSDGDDSPSASRSINVSIINDVPTLDPLSDITGLDEDASTQSVNLSGISSGDPAESQTLTVTATSSNTSLVPTPTINYTSPSQTGTLTFTPVTDAYGTVTITVEVSDGGATNSTTSQQFEVTINSVNDAPSIDPVSDPESIDEDTTSDQVINLSGIGPGASNESQTITIQATSSDASIVPHPSVSYNSGDATASLTYVPEPDAFGDVDITITVSDGDTVNAETLVVFTVSVAPVNDLPTLDFINNPSAIQEDTSSIQTINLSGITTGALNENQTLSITAVSDNSSLIENPAIDYTSPNSTATLSYVPLADQNGTATITVTLNDGGSVNNLVQRTFDVVVTAVNDAPTLDAISNPAAILEDTEGDQTINLSGISTGAINELQDISINVSSSNTDLIPTPIIDYTSANSTGMITYSVLPDAHGTSTITLTVSDSGNGTNSTSRSFDVEVTSVNDVPTLNSIPDPDTFIEDDSEEKVVALGGISTGAVNELQTLTITASSSNETLVSPPTVEYTSPGSSAILRYSINPDVSGSADITVTVNDGDTVNQDFQQTFSVEVTEVNDTPTLNSILNPSAIDEDTTDTQDVSLSGITTGSPNEDQTLIVTAVSSDTALIPNPTVTYVSPNSDALIQYVPVPNAYGTATVTVTVSDGGGGNETVVQTFDVEVSPVNDIPTIDLIEDLPDVIEDSGPQLVALTGITSGQINENQPLTVIAISNNESLIPTPVISYSSPNSSGTLTFTPEAEQSGQALLTVSVYDGGGGTDTITESFLVTVNSINDKPTLDTITNPPAFDEDDQTVKTITLSGISTGAVNEDQTLEISVSSSNETLIATPQITYTSPNTTGTLSYQATPDLNGVSTITVRVEEPGVTENAFVEQVFDVVVNSINDQPTIDAIDNPAAIGEDTVAPQTINFSGVSDGSVNEVQPLTVVAVSSDTDIMPNPTVTYSSPDASGSLSYTPLPDAFGTVLVSVIVGDGGNENYEKIEEFEVIITPINDRPTINTVNDPAAIDEDSATQTVNLSGISMGASNEDQTLRIIATSSNPTVVPHPTVNYISPNYTGSLSYAPIEDMHGSSTITVEVNDGGDGNTSEFINFEVVVNSVNDRPTLDSISNVGPLPEGTTEAQTITLTGLSTGAINENQTLIYEAVSSDPTIVPHPTIDYTPGENTAILSFTPVNDGYGMVTITVTGTETEETEFNTIVRTFTINITPINDQPTLDPITSPEPIDEDTTATQVINLSGITSGAENENQTLTVTAVSSNIDLIPHPAVTYSSPEASGSLLYVPNPDQFGSAVISVSVSDGGGGSDLIERTFTVNVDPVNDEPTIDAISDIGPLLEDSGVQTVNLSGITTGSLVEDQTLVVTAVSDNPSVVSNPGVTYTSPNSTAVLSVEPLADSFGVANITVTVNDGGGGTETVESTFQVTIDPVNDVPVFDALSDVEPITEGDTSEVTVPLTGINSGAANESQTLVVSVISSDTSIIPTPSVSYVSADQEGSLSFAPIDDKFGDVTITVALSDGIDQVQNEFLVQVIPVNDPPTLDEVSSPAPIDEDTTVSQEISLTGITTGSPNETQNISIIAESSNKLLIPDPQVSYTSPDSTATLSYVPVPSSNGTSTVTITVQDDGGGTDTVQQTFEVVVNSVNDQPTLDAIADPNSISEDAGEQSVSISGITTGAFNEDQTLVVTASSSDISLIPNPSVTYSSPDEAGTLTYTPVPDANGSATITVTVSDGGTENSTVVQTFEVVVESVNDQPTLDTLSTPDPLTEETALEQSMSLTGISTGAANENQTLVVTATSSNTALIPNPTVTYTSPDPVGTIAYTPVADAFGTATITVSVSDGGTTDATVVQTFEVVVNGINDQPTFNAIADQSGILEDTSIPHNVALSNITSGSPNEFQTLTLTAVSSNPSIVPDPTLTYTSPNTTANLSFLPVADQNGTVTITVTLNDGADENNVLTRTFDLTIAPVNDAPTFETIPDKAVFIGQDYTLDLTGIVTNDIDLPANNLTWSVSVVNDNVDGGTAFPGGTGDIAAQSPGVFFFLSEAGFNGKIEVRATLTDDGTSNGNPDVKFASQNLIIDWLDDTNPTINENLITSYSAVEDNDLVIILSDDDKGDNEDPDSALSWSVQNFDNGSVNVSGNTITFTPNADFNTDDEVDSVDLILTDSVGGSDLITLNLSWTPVNEPPVFTKGLDVTVDEDAGEQIVSGWATGMSTGPLNEYHQALTEFSVVSNSNLGLFAEGPSVTTTGELSFTPADNAYGSASVSITLSDNGSSEGDNVNTSESQSFTITVNPINDAPTFVLGDNIVVDEDAGAQTMPAWITGISEGATNEGAQSLNDFEIVSNSNISLFSDTPSITSAGELSFTPADNLFGEATIVVTLSDSGSSIGDNVNTSVEQSFTITVNSVNDAPTFTTLPDQSSSTGDTFDLDLTTLGAPSDTDTTDSLSWSVSVTNTSVDGQTTWTGTVTETSEGSGVFRFDPNNVSFDGKIEVEIVLSDNGEPSESITQSGLIIDWIVNDKPVIRSDLDTAYSSDEDDDIVITLTDADKSDTEDPDASLVWSIVGFENGTAVVVDNQITLSPNLNFAGTEEVTLILTDLNNGTDSISLDLTWNPINDAPSFDLGGTVTIVEDAGAQVFTNWVTNIWNEDDQVLSDFVITNNTNTELFEFVPQITNQGELSFTPNADAYGTAEITVTLSDDGPTGGDNQNTSPEATFTIEVLPVNDAPTFVKGSDQIVPMNSDLRTIELWATDITIGSTNESDQNYSGFVVTNNTATSLFQQGPSIDEQGNLSYQPAEGEFGEASITIVLIDNGGTDNAGNDTSLPATFVITVAEINDYTSEPTTDITANSTSGLVSLDDGDSHVHLRHDQTFLVQSGIETVTTEGDFEGVSYQEALSQVSHLEFGADQMDSVTIDSGIEGEMVVISSDQNLQVSIPDDTTIQADINWDGRIYPPTDASNITELNHYDVQAAISVGSPDYALLTDKPVKVVLPADVGTPFYSPDGGTTWVEIKNLCADIYGTGLTYPNECYFRTTGQTIIWTYHMTLFMIGKPIEYTATNLPGSTSGKAKSVRYAGQTKRQYKNTTDLGPIGKDNFEEAYQKSLKAAKQMDDARQPGKVLKRITETGREKFYGYLPGRVALEDMSNIRENRLPLRRLMVRDNKMEEFKASSPALVSKDTIFDMADVSTQHKYYPSIAQMVSYGLMRPDRSHAFNPHLPVAWDIVLHAILKGQGKSVSFLSDLEEAELPEIAGLPLDTDYSSLTLYTALNEGIIDENFNLENFPTRGDVLKLLSHAFNLNVIEKSNNTSFVDVERDNAIAPYLVAAKLANWFENFSGHRFRPEQTITRSEFADWFIHGYTDYEVMNSSAPKSDLESKKQRVRDFYSDTPLYSNWPKIQID